MSKSKRIASKINHSHTELLDLNGFDAKRIHFDSPSEMEIQQGNKVIKYYNINIGSKNDSGIGEFIFNIPFQTHSFGIEEFQNEQGIATNHGVSLSIVDAANPTKEQLEFVQEFSKVVDTIKDHVLSIKKEIKKPTLDRSDLKKFNPMYQSLDEDGNPKGNSWYFSPKLMERKRYNDDGSFTIDIQTKFYEEDKFDESGEPLEISPLEFVGKKHFKFRGAIKIDKIYVGSKITLQCKIYDGAVQTVTSERKRLTTFKTERSSLLEDE
jgi:hypothetical protein